MACLWIPSQLHVQRCHVDRYTYLSFKLYDILLLVVGGQLRSRLEGLVVACSKNSLIWVNTSCFSARYESCVGKNIFFEQKVCHPSNLKGVFAHCQKVY